MQAEINKLELPELGYSANALEPTLVGEILEVHHKKHHNGNFLRISKLASRKSWIHIFQNFYYSQNYFLYGEKNYFLAFGKWKRWGLRVKESYDINFEYFIRV